MRRAPGSACAPTSTPSWRRSIPSTRRWSWWATPAAGPSSMAPSMPARTGWPGLSTWTADRWGRAGSSMTNLPADGDEVPLPPWELFEDEDLTDLTDELRAMFRARAIPQPRGVAQDRQQLSDERRFEVPVTVIACEFPSSMLTEMVAGGHPYRGGARTDPPGRLRGPAYRTLAAVHQAGRARRRDPGRRRPDLRELAGRVTAELGKSRRNSPPLGPAAGASRQTAGDFLRVGVKRGEIRVQPRLTAAVSGRTGPGLLPASRSGRERPSRCAWPASWPGGHSGQ